MSSENETPTASWSPARRVAFRFLFAYVALFLSQAIPVWDPAATAFGRVMGIAAPPPSTTFGGSGDKTVDWLALLLALLLAAVATAVWSILDRKRVAYPRLAAWLRVAVRYGLAWTMLIYGAGKVTHVQFPMPSGIRLATEYGQSSPMGLLWTFMGYSTAYNVFTGMAECVGGLLLWSRRTTTLGALIVIGVMSNVVMLNYCYDVPVKIFSSHLLLAGVFLAAPDARRLADVFVLGRAAGAPAHAAHFATPRGQRLGRMVKWVALALSLASAAALNVVAAMQSSARDAPALYGTWEVASFVRGGSDVPPLVTDGTRWRRMRVGASGTVVFQAMTGALDTYKAKDDAATQEIALTRQGDGGGDAASVSWVLSYERTDANHVVLRGTFRDVAVQAAMVREDEARLPLWARGFHWVNERPFNY